MTNEEKVEKMAYSICTLPQVSSYITSCSYCGLSGDCLRQKHAKEFMEKGYGDIRSALTEFAERVKMAFYYEFDELIPSTMADKIDELVKEICGQ